MKELSLVRTQNVRETEKMISYLLNRPKTEMVGLGLIYGQPGLGKSRFARQTAIRDDYIYMRLESTMTAKSFSIRLLELVQYHFGMTKTRPRGTTNDVFNTVINILRMHDNTVIVIDEIDYAFKMRKLLGTISDIVDETLSVVILVGLADARDRLLMADSHYFDRCNYFYEFQRLSRVDVELVCKKVSDVKMCSDLLSFIHKSTHGNFRQIIKIIEAVEKVAATRNLVEVALTDLLETQELKNAS